MFPLRSRVVVERSGECSLTFEWNSVISPLENGCAGGDKFSVALTKVELAVKV